MNRNDIAKEIAKEEGMKTELSIAQIKEVLRLVFTIYTLEDIVRMWIRWNK